MMEIIGLVHSEVFMPNNVKATAKRIQKLFTNVIHSRHFNEQCVINEDYKHYLEADKVDNIILNLKNDPIIPFEAEIGRLNGKLVVTKLVIRTAYDADRDISIAIIPKVNSDRRTFAAFVKTAWLNSNTDIQYTLDRTKYLTEL